MPMIGGSLHPLDEDRRCFAYCGDDLCTCDARPDDIFLHRREGRDGSAPHAEPIPVKDD